MNHRVKMLILLYSFILYQCGYQFQQRSIKKRAIKAIEVSIDQRCDSRFYALLKSSLASELTYRGFRIEATNERAPIASVKLFRCHEGQAFSKMSRLEVSAEAALYDPLKKRVIWRSGIIDDELATPRYTPPQVGESAEMLNLRAIAEKLAKTIVVDLL